MAERKKCCALFVLICSVGGRKVAATPFFGAGAPATWQRTLIEKYNFNEAATMLATLAANCNTIQGNFSLLRRINKQTKSK